MDVETLSRVQFALTASFHFIFPPLSMGLGLMLVVLGVIYVRTKDPKWRQLSFFWVKVYGLIFALGVATGVVQEFEFGMNWADYSRFVGNVFGSLLAAEGVFAFFLEGGFLGLMLFGGNRLGPKLWLFSIFMVVFGAHFSALWIIMANSWMQTPQGYTIAQDPAPARAVMTDFWEVVFTPSFVPRILHVFAASWTVGAALMVSVSAWYILKKRHLDLAKSNIKVALPALILFATANIFIFGPNQAIEVTNEQPLKLASMEGLWQSTSCAPMYLIGRVDEATQTTSGISIPCLLSFLAYQDINATVQGIDSFAPAPTPPIALLFQAYHFMPRGGNSDKACEASGRVNYAGCGRPLRSVVRDSTIQLGPCLSSVVREQGFEQLAGDRTPAF
jgi:cytochrome d ubiquinol oxidase subunit I